jgi:hypothetical protein
MSVHFGPGLQLALFDASMYPYAFNSDTTDDLVTTRQGPYFGFKLVQCRTFRRLLNIFSRPVP